MVGQYLPQINEKWYNMLQCSMWLFPFFFLHLNTTLVSLRFRSVLSSSMHVCCTASCRVGPVKYGSVWACMPMPSSLESYILINQLRGGGCWYLHRLLIIFHFTKLEVLLHLCKESALWYWFSLRTFYASFHKLLAHKWNGFAPTPLFFNYSHSIIFLSVSNYKSVQLFLYFFQLWTLLFLFF